MRLSARSTCHLAAALLAASLLPPIAAGAAGTLPVITHDLQVTLDPAAGTLEVSDAVSVPDEILSADRAFVFSLNRSLQVTLPARDSFSAVETEDGVSRYSIALPEDHTLLLEYSGRLVSEERGAASHIGREGAYLTGASAWYPIVPGTLVRSRLAARVPIGWLAVSQGRREPSAAAGPSAPLRWIEDHPQRDIYLVAGPWHAFEAEASEPSILVYLRSPERALAERYLEAGERHVRLYSRLLGPYPYAKLAVIENFWDSGLGFPSFTMLGPRVIRFPFVLESSFPHEIVHNWWGNGVYVDYPGGNWSEGLTAYLADHLVREEKGEGASYRRDALLKYRNYVAEGDDFPLRQFTGKHGDASEAIGYNKALMVFHMLRRRLGDDGFLRGLREFYAENRFRVAGYGELRRAFETASGASLESFFTQWVERAGAPELAVEDAHVVAGNAGFEVRATLRQTQGGPAYELDVPLVIQTAEGLSFHAVTMRENVLEVELDVASAPVRLLVDPELDLFRRLALKETPPTLGETLGSLEAIAILPSGCDVHCREAYRYLAHAIGVTRTRIDTDLDHLPKSIPVWVLGWENRLAAEVRAALAPFGVELTQVGAHLDGRLERREASCVVLAGRTREGAPFGFVGCDEREAMPGLARKLTHYGAYGYLTFEGAVPENRVKGRWPPVSSPLHIAFEPRVELPLPVLPPRASLAASVR